MPIVSAQKDTSKLLSGRYNERLRFHLGIGSTEAVNPPGFDPVTPPAGTYVMTTGDDGTGESGNYAKPFASLKAAAAADATGQIWVEGGTYTHNYTTDIITINALTTVSGYGTERPQIIMTWSGGINTAGIWRMRESTVIENLDLSFSATTANDVSFCVPTNASYTGLFRNCVLRCNDVTANKRALIGYVSAAVHYCYKTQNCEMYLKRSTTYGASYGRRFFAAAVSGGYSHQNNIYFIDQDVYYAALGFSSESCAADTSDYCFATIAEVTGDGKENSTLAIRAGEAVDYQDAGELPYSVYAPSGFSGNIRYQYKGAGQFSGGASGLTLTMKDSPTYESNQIESIFDSGGSLDSSNWAQSATTTFILNHTDGGHNQFGQSDINDQTDTYRWSNNHPIIAACENAGNPDSAYNNPDGSRNHIGIWGGPNAWV